VVLVDTSVWVSYFRWGNVQLQSLLIEDVVVCHPFIIGELACGHLRNRKEILSLLQFLPSVRMPDSVEVLEFIEQNHLMGFGIGFIDVHLLASALLNRVSVWTFDKKMRQAATKLKVLQQISHMP
jgi:predicted nucleic acid-binding protein